MAVSAAGQNYLTFWSMEPPYFDGRLRYHLGQISMLERLAANIEAGGRSTAIICDPPVILSSRNRPEARQQRDTIYRFLRILSHKDVEIFFLSDINSGFRNEEEAYQAIEAQSLVSFADINSVAASIELSNQARTDLAANRSSVVAEPSFSLEAPLKILRQYFDVSDTELLATLYAFTYRATWFESHHLAATAATLALLTESTDNGKAPVILEAERNAYPWLVVQTLVKHACSKGTLDGISLPALELCKSIPGIDGSPYMRLSEGATCLFIDEPHQDFIRKINNTTDIFYASAVEAFPELTTDTDPRKSVRSVLNDYRARALMEGLLRTVRKDDPEDSANVHLILGGGGAKGLALVGAIDELWEHYKFGQFWGTSAGSIIAVLLGAGFTPSELRKVCLETPFETFLDSGVLRTGWNVLRHRALHRANEFEPWITDLLKSKLGTKRSPTMKELPKRTVVFATQRRAGTVCFDSEGENKDAPAAFAVRSSISYPFFIAPSNLYGERAYDGGLTSNYPLDRFKERHPNEAHVGIALRSFAEKSEAPLAKLIPRTFKDIFNIWLEQDETSLIEKDKEKTIVVDTTPLGTFDLSLSELEMKFLHAIGAAQAAKFLHARGLMGNTKRESLITTAERLRREVEEPLGEE
ncbi:MAG: patatin-like phospholipase family protein [Pseudomonadota bacterium]